jgi:glycosyltransferase involved in cell wall biosynthesis
MSAPAITVLMPLYNAAPFLDEAIDSILAQTWTAFELLVIDDGSTDGSLEKVSARTDTRIRVEKLPHNQGVVAALNRGLQLAQGAYIARMDADDIAHPERLAKQLAYMEKHPEVGALGSDFESFGGSSSASWVRHFDAENLHIALLFENPICHPTVMLRRSTLDALGLGYPDDALHAEEYALWIQIATRSRLANLPERLLRYRVHNQQISRLKSAEQCRTIDRLVGAQLDALGLKSGARDFRIHHAMGNGFYPKPYLDLAMRAWVQTLRTANDRMKVYDPEVFARQLDKRIEHTLVRHREALRAMPRHRRWHWQVSTWLDSVWAKDPR